MNVLQLFWESLPQSVTILVIVDFIIRIIALGVIPHNRRPSVAWGWLLAVFFVPLLGLLAFWLLGRSSLSSERKSKQRSISSRIAHEAHPADAYAVGDTLGSAWLGVSGGSPQLR